jgi:hypothetical protein
LLHESKYVDFIVGKRIIKSVQKIIDQITNARDAETDPLKKRLLKMLLDKYNRSTEGGVSSPGTQEAAAITLHFIANLQKREIEGMCRGEVDYCTLAVSKYQEEGRREEKERREKEEKEMREMKERKNKETFVTIQEPGLVVNVHGSPNFVPPRPSKRATPGGRPHSLEKHASQPAKKDGGIPVKPAVSGMPLLGVPATVAQQGTLGHRILVSRSRNPTQPLTFG